MLRHKRVSAAATPAPAPAEGGGAGFNHEALAQQSTSQRGSSSTPRAAQLVATIVALNGGSGSGSVDSLGGSQKLHRQVSESRAADTLPAPRR